VNLKSYRPFLNLVLGVFCLLGMGSLASIGAQAQDTKPAIDVSGTWSATMSSPMGEMEIIYKLKVTDGKITGTATMPFGESPIVDGAIEGENIHFVVQMEAFGNTTKAEAKGKIVGDTLVLTPAMPAPPDAGDGPGDFKVVPLTFHRKNA